MLAALPAGLAAVLVLSAVALAAPPEPSLTPVRRAVDLDVGDSARVTLADGAEAAVKLLGVEVQADPARDAPALVRVRVEVNGQAATLTSANYRLPQVVGGVRVDCPITQDYYKFTSKADPWGLVKAARLRLWPKDGPLLAPGTFVYPVPQRWLASDTQMANQACYVDGGEMFQTTIYYHSGLDFGGAEGMVDILCATDGLVVSSAGQTLDGYKDTPVAPRADVVYVLDKRGWYYRYSHMKTIDAGIRPGAEVRMGQKVGVLGKEGGSGGWSHLHFEIKALQPSGKWGTEEAYAYAWEAYQRERGPALAAVARPHILTVPGHEVTLDGSLSRAPGGEIASYEWTLSDGARAAGPTLKRTYTAPGTYSEILKVTDASGRAAYDFAVVQVIDKAKPKELPPTIHANFEPTLGVKAGQALTFKVRTFRTQAGEEVWDFGDGSPPVTVHSDGNANMHDPNGYAVTTHAYARPGDYIATVRRTGHTGATATGRVWVHVE
jgi:hypothetical protein